MLFSRTFLPVMALFAASTTAAPTAAAIETRQITSPSIIQSVGFDVDVAVDARAKAGLNIAEIFKNARKNKEFAVVTAGKIQKQVATMIVAFTSATYAIEGDLADSIKRIGNEEAALLKSASDKVIAMANKMADNAKEIGEKEEKDVLKLLKGEGLALMTAIRAIFTPIEAFVASSTEDVEFPGALKRAKDDSAKAARDLDALVKKFSA